jgi:hypothetical protein
MLLYLTKILRMSISMFGRFFNYGMSYEPHVYIYLKLICELCRILCMKNYGIFLMHVFTKVIAQKLYRFLILESFISNDMMISVCLLLFWKWDKCSNILNWEIDFVLCKEFSECEIWKCFRNWELCFDENVWAILECGFLSSQMGDIPVLAYTKLRMFFDRRPSLVSRLFWVGHPVLMWIHFEIVIFYSIFKSI